MTANKISKGFLTFLLASIISCRPKANLSEAKLSDRLTVLSELVAIKDVVLWAYAKEISQRVYVASAEDVYIPNQAKTISIKDSKFYTLLILHHEYDTCYVESLANLAKYEDIGPILALKYNLQDPNKFYIACPLYDGPALSGYISGIMESHGQTLISKQNKLKVLTKAMGTDL